MTARLLACLFVIAWSGAVVARSKPPASPLPDPNACGPAIAAAEKRYQLPAKLLGTIALVESGQPDPVTGRIAPWPWTIDAQNTGWFFASKAEAIAAVTEFRAAGVQSVDVGCMQINLVHHPDAFASLEEAFDPAANAMYGARFLSGLYRQLGSWPQAAAAYHSQTPELAQVYESKVMALWPLASQYPDPGLPSQGPLGVASAADRRASRPDYSLYTPEFAERTRRLDADLAKVAARFGPGPAPDAAQRGAVKAVTGRGTRYPRPEPLPRGAAIGCLTSAGVCGRRPG